MDSTMISSIRDQLLQEPARDKRIHDWITEQYDFVTECDDLGTEEEVILRPDSPLLGFLELPGSHGQSSLSYDYLFPVRDTNACDMEEVECERALEFLLREMQKNPVSHGAIQTTMKSQFKSQSPTCVADNIPTTQDADREPTRCCTPTPRQSWRTATPTLSYPIHSSPGHSPTSSFDTVTTSFPSTPTLSHGGSSSQSSASLPGGWDSDVADAIHIPSIPNSSRSLKSPSKSLKLRAKKSMPFLSSFQFGSSAKLSEPAPVSPRSQSFDGPSLPAILPKASTYSSHRPHPLSLVTDVSTREPSSRWSISSDDESLISPVELDGPNEVGLSPTPKDKSKRPRLKSFISKLKGGSGSSSGASTPTSSSSNSFSDLLNGSKSSVPPTHHVDLISAGFPSTMTSRTVRSVSEPQTHVARSRSNSGSSRSILGAPRPSLDSAEEVFLLTAPRPHYFNDSMISLSTRDGRHDSVISFANLLRSQPKSKLVITTPNVSDITRSMKDLKAWCETFGEVRRVKAQNSGQIHVTFVDSAIIDTICQRQHQAEIAGVGLVLLSSLHNSKA